MNNSKLYLISLVIILFSCSENNVFESVLVEKEQNYNEDNYIIRSLEDVINESNTLILSLSEAKTRNSEKLMIKNIEAIPLRNNLLNTRNINLRDNSDSILYILNYDNNMGFTIVSRLKELPAVYCWIKNSNFSINEEDSLPLPLALCLERAILDMAVVEESSNDPTFKPVAIDALPSTLNLKRKVTPHLGDLRWNQSEPYNYYTPIKSNKQSPVGCVAVAVGQILTYIKKGKIESFTGWNGETTIIDWTKLKNETANSSLANYYPSESRKAALLLRTIGHEVSMDYGSNSSGAKSKDAINYIKRLGISATDLKQFNDNNVMNELDKGQILYMSGARNNLDLWVINIPYNGHAWVIDGYYHYERPLTMAEYYQMDPIITAGTTIEDFPPITFSYFHNNFGWGTSQKTGYFLSSYGSVLNNIPYKHSLKYSSITPL